MIDHIFNKIDPQLQSNDCAISVAKTLCNIHGINIPRKTISDQVQLDQRGASLDHLNVFFKKLGFKTQYKLIDWQSLNGKEEELKDALPCVAPVRLGLRRGVHFIIIDAYHKGKLHILDPAQGQPYYLTFAAFKQIAYSSRSQFEYADLEEQLRVKVSAEIARYNITLRNELNPRTWVEAFGKLSYFQYIKSNFPFQSASVEKSFLEDLLWHQDFISLPRQFRQLQPEATQVTLQVPVLLSVQAPVIRDIPKAEQGQDQNLYLTLYRQLGKIKSIWLIFLATTLVAAGITYVSVFINQILIDSILPTYQLSTLTLFIIGVGVFYLFDLIFLMYQKYIAIHLGNELDRYFLSVFDQKLNDFSIRYLQRFRRGDLTERLSDAIKLKVFFLSFFSKIFTQIIIAILSLSILVVVHWQLSILVFVVLLLFVAMFYYLTPHIRSLEQQRFICKADFFSRFIEKIDGIQSVKSMQLEEFSSHEINKSIDALIKVQTKSRFLGLFNTVASSFIVSAATLVIILLTSREMIVYHSFSLGMIITFVALSKKIFHAFSSLLDYNLDLQENQVILRRFFDFQEAEDHRRKPSTHRLNLIQDFSFESMEWRNLSFGYDEDRPVLRQLYLQLKQSEKIWIQGKNGSGKSTLCRILGLLYEPDSGDCKINDLNIQLFDPEVVRSKVVLISNEDILFNDSLLFNITFGRQVDMSLLQDLSRRIGFYDFVDGHPDKFDMLIYENGKNLSTGQRKKVLLLRALMSSADVLILDELFNGIDRESKELAEALINDNEDKSFIIISHMPVEHIRFHKKYLLEHGELTLFRA